MLDLSSHPVDRLIREIIVADRQASPEEIGDIVERIASAPFDPRPDVVVATKDRGLSYLGHVLGPRAPALTYHLAKRVIDDRQWAFGTTAADYLADLHAAVRSFDTRFALYRRRGGHMAACLAANRVVPRRLGPDSERFVLVVFSADRGTIITGYQTSFELPANIPEDALWLK